MDLGFNIDLEFVTGTIAYVGYLFDATKLLLLLIVGLPLAFWVLRRIVGMVRVR